MEKLCASATHSPGSSRSVCCLKVLTLSAVRGSMVLPGNPWLLSRSLSPRTKVKKNPYKNGRGSTDTSTPFPATTLRPLHIPETSPAKLDNTQPRRVTVPLRTSPPSVQQCPQPYGNRIPTSTPPRCRNAAETAELRSIRHLDTPAAV